MLVCFLHLRRFLETAIFKAIIDNLDRADRVYFTATINKLKIEGNWAIQHQSDLRRTKTFIFRNV